MRPDLENWILMNLPKRLELSLRSVRALPKYGGRVFCSPRCGVRRGQVSKAKESKAKKAKKAKQRKGRIINKLTKGLEHGVCVEDALLELANHRVTSLQVVLLVHDGNAS